MSRLVLIYQHLEVKRKDNYAHHQNKEEESNKAGIPLIIAFVVAVVLMMVAISKWKVHPFLSIIGIFLVSLFF